MDDILKISREKLSNKVGDVEYCIQKYSHAKNQELGKGPDQIYNADEKLQGSEHFEDWLFASEDYFRLKSLGL